MPHEWSLIWETSTFFENSSPPLLLWCCTLLVFPKAFNVKHPWEWKYGKESRQVWWLQNKAEVSVQTVEISAKIYSQENNGKVVFLGKVWGEVKKTIGFTWSGVRSRVEKVLVIGIADKECSLSLQMELEVRKKIKAKIFNA